MNKRGQIYIIAALILSVAIFMLISQTNFVQRILFEDDFEQISRNFDVESAKFMNNLLAGGDMESLESDFREFTSVFTDYAKVENPEYEFIYILDYPGKPLVGYYIQTEDVEFIPELVSVGTDVTDVGIAVSGMGIPVAVLGKSKVVEGSIDSVIIRGMEYILNTQGGVPQIIIIGRAEKGEQTKVYLNEEFVTGKKVVI